MLRRAMVSVCLGMAVCGPTASDGSGDATTSGGTSGGSGSEGASTAPADSTGSAPRCEDYGDAPVTGEPLMVEIHNVGAEAILLADPCFDHDYLELTTESELQWPADFCRETCVGEFVTGCIDCGACAEAAYVVVPPGAVQSVEWDGMLYARVEPPDACFEVGACAPSCQQRVTPGEETVLVTVFAITESDCRDGEPVPDEACTCDPGPDGVCQTNGSALIDPTRTASVEWTPGSPGPIVLEIE